MHGVLLKSERVASSVGCTQPQEKLTKKTTKRWEKIDYNAKFGASPTVRGDSPKGKGGPAGIHAFGLRL